MNTHEIIKFVKPSKDHEHEVKELNQELIDNGDAPISWPRDASNFNDYNKWLQLLDTHSGGVDLEYPWVKSDTYLAIRENDNKIIGMVNIRHGLNENLLKENGHVGYLVRPSDRRKGYATEILRLALAKLAKKRVNKVLVCCNKENIGSVKTIQKNGGILENEVEHSASSPSNRIIFQRYWIDVTQRK
jgi:predicted acetyltransferase